MIEGNDLVHRSPSRYRQQICGVRQPVPSEMAVHLKAQSGWQASGWKLIRDLTVADLSLLPDDTHGRYLYFFVGQPSQFNLKANAGETSGIDHVDTYLIKGSDLLERCASLFFRPLDKVLVARGDYVGPARLIPG